MVPRFNYDLDLTDEEDGLLQSYEMLDMDVELDRGDGLSNANANNNNLPIYAIIFRAHSAILDKATTLKMLKEEIADQKESEV